MRIFGIEYTTKQNCCYVLVKLTKKQRSVELDSLQGVGVKDYVTRAIEKLNVSDTSEVRRFMRSYGTHYINSYVTGDFIYQVGAYVIIIVIILGHHLLSLIVRAQSLLFLVYLVIKLNIKLFYGAPYI